MPARAKGWRPPGRRPVKAEMSILALAMPTRALTLPRAVDAGLLTKVPWKLSDGM
jgi:hypothetical protein